MSSLLLAGVLAATLLTAPPAAARDDSEGKRASRAAARIHTLADLPPVWRRLAMCESSGRARVVSPSGLHHGYFQIHRGFFTNHGLDPRTATLAQQFRLALAVYERQGARAWTCADKAGLR